ncbi:hypothetical protein J7T55_012558 [Diaporthe amygdali]|uniref:uncharacterized protein n=1 Tax=Phomopsis amygdali TaxID=1214568 RepID=UPI0022FE001C|nr:uncharacterized protein J7T55_012558 [Diaporthe amygdali]KAJ0115282.1 hypothetical protein J7T55_012558 [Diaporthe amygdali]
MSFASSLRKLLPINRPEKGHARRARTIGLSESLQDGAEPFKKSETPVSDSRNESADRIVRWNTAIEPSSNTSPSTRSQQLYLAHREKRRLRRSLRESGDYLGVQGINPVTGELDVLTPTTSSASEFASLAQTVADKRSAYETARRKLQAEKMRKWERDKEAIKAEHRNNVRWMKNRSGWSSAIEPALSPIAQSSATTTPRDEESTGTVVRTPSVRHASQDDPEHSRTTGTTPGQSLNNGVTSGLRRKPVLQNAQARTLSSQRSYSDLIPVESEFPGEMSPRPPRVGPKPEVSVTGALRDRAGSYGTRSGRGTGHEEPRNVPFQRRYDDSGTVTSRQRSASSALHIRSRSTPESDLDPSKPGSMTYGYYADQQGSQKSEPRGQPPRSSYSRASESRTASSALENRKSRRKTRSDGITIGGSSYKEARKNTGGKVCLHTHHHHYWILSDSVALQSMPNLRSSRERVPLQKADENRRMAAFPDESDVEGLAEARRPPSRNTNRRYFIEG